MNADKYTSTGQGLNGTNMFSYCGSNPISRIDSTGTKYVDGNTAKQITDTAWTVIVGGLGTAVATPLISLGAGIGGMALGISAIAILITNAIDNSNIKSAPLSTSDPKPTPNPVPRETPRESKNAIVNIPATLKNTASKYPNGRCDSAADAMKNVLKKQKKSGNIVTITWIPPGGFIWSDLAQKSVGNNGYHMGVEYEGIIYCNIHSTGLPEQMWVDDFNAPGEKVVTKIPIN